MKLLVDIRDDNLAALAQRVADHMAPLLERPQRGPESDQVFDVRGLDIHKSLAQAVADAVVARLKPMLFGLERHPQQAGDPTSRSGKQSGRQGGLPQSGYVRLKDVLSVVPVSKSSWWVGIREGRFPRPTKKFGPRIAAWDVQDIRALLEWGVV